MARCLTIVAFAPMFILGLGAEVSARSKPAPAQTEEAPAAATETAVQPAEAAAPPEAAAEAEAPVAAEDAAPPKPVNPPQFGVGFRARMISLPSAFLKAFTIANQGLLSYGLGLEGFRRKRDVENPNRFSEISFAVTYQNMSPPDGNWLGNGHNASVDTDWVQFKNFGFWTIDISFIERQYFNDVFGIHYGAGVGLSIVQGDVLRTSSSSACTDANIGNTSICRPIVCTSLAAGCTETELANSTKNNRPPDTATNPWRFREGAVWPAAPALTLLTGLDFRIPQAQGLEFRIDAGFFDFLVIFVGGSVAYVF
ncbi:MAG: hypothetical protein WCG85_12615 [Polyangia bacterium]